MLTESNCFQDRVDGILSSILSTGTKYPGFIENEIMNQRLKSGVPISDELIGRWELLAKEQNVLFAPETDGNGYI